MPNREQAIKNAGAATHEALSEALKRMPDGPNVEASPWELDAACGELPLAGPRAGGSEPPQMPDPKG